MQQTPVYQGYIQPAAGRPTFVYSTGFLVQSDPNPAMCGWYSFRHAHQIMCNVDPTFFIRIQRSLSTPALMEKVMHEMIELLAEASMEESDSVGDSLEDNYAEPKRDRPSGRIRKPNNTERFVILDTPSDDHYEASPVYLFERPLHLVGSEGFAAQFGEIAAAQVVGPFDGNGEPLNQRKIVPRANAQLHFG